MTDDDILHRQAVDAAERGDADFMRRWLSSNPPRAVYTALPLVRAAAARQLDIVRMIVEKAGAEAFREMPHVLEIALRNKDWAMADYLLDKGAEPRLNNAVNLQHVHVDAPLGLLKKMLERESPGTRGRYLDTLFFLNIARSEERADILDWALSESRLAEHMRRVFFTQTLDQKPSLLHVLKKHGWFYAEADAGESPVSRAIEKGNAEGVKALLSLGADPDAMATHPYYPLIIAVHKGQTESVQALLAAGADALAHNGQALRHARSSPENAELLAMMEEAYRAQTVKAAAEFDGKDLFKAARGGLFAKIAAEAAEKGEKLDPVEVARVELDRSKSGCHIIGMLKTQGQLPSLLDTRLWQDPETAFRLFATCLTGEAREKFEREAQSALQKMHADNLAANMRKKNGGPRYRL